MPLEKLWSVLGLCLLSVGAWGQEDNKDIGKGMFALYNLFSNVEPNVVGDNRHNTH